MSSFDSIEKDAKTETVHVDHGGFAGLKDGEVILQISNQNGRSWPYSTFRVEDLVKAVNEIEGVTATYEPPKPPLPTLADIEPGTAFRFAPHGPLYIKLVGNRLTSAANPGDLNTITPYDLTRTVYAEEGKS